MNARRVLDQWGIRPSKGLGQNFISDPVIVQKIVAAAEPGPGDVILEVGAGLGTMTALLARDAGHVIAVELDQRLIPVLQSELAGLDNVTLIQGDVLALDPAVLVGETDLQYKVVANLPYYITSAVIRHLLEATLKPRQMVLTVQREVAERIVAKPGQMSLLALSVQFYGRPTLLFRVKPGSFYPAPGVQSAVVRVDVHETPTVPVEETDAFFRVARAGFSQRRKQLRNALGAGLGRSPAEVAARLEQVGVDPRRRAETLSLEEWVKVAHVLRQ
jgi:16S rRNA (adenine1518-N6/adenine1519-N6)-dimethyltransferase